MDDSKCNYQQALGVSICLDIVSIKSLNLGSLKKQVLTVQKCLTKPKSRQSRYPQVSIFDMVSIESPNLNSFITQVSTVQTFLTVSKSKSRQLGRSPGLAITYTEIAVAIDNRNRKRIDFSSHISSISAFYLITSIYAFYLISSISDFYPMSPFSSPFSLFLLFE